MAVVCAAVLAGWLGMLGLSPAPFTGAPAGAPRQATASRTPGLSSTSSSPKLGWEEAGLLHGSHVGAPRAGSRDQVEGAGAGLRPQTPFTPRPDTLRAILARHDARMLARAEGLLARALPSRLTPLADRPRTVNCPAQGPPVQG
ncbi:MULTISPECIES: hypothetical protein [unclassified Corallococcus]|uniref:hypothetical protein n=1 Tax=unclassified Corallococcus TaxID=2685029 RepID=UPI001A907F4F|nr:MULTISPECIES: hypothetical protein [unclassified Corallococcus]MBN9685140.1 hypothetical protein [Corallococcus sp. NCSPR001]WAS83401.1 hypothetical protein O0N60_29315 [Corallococcus sp. NCRR]